MEAPTLRIGVLVKDSDPGEWPRNALRVATCARFVAKLRNSKALAMIRLSMVFILNAVEKKLHSISVTLFLKMKIQPNLYSL